MDEDTDDADSEDGSLDGVDQTWLYKAPPRNNRDDDPDYQPGDEIAFINMMENLLLTAKDRPYDIINHPYNLTGGVKRKQGGEPRQPKRTRWSN